MKYFFIFFLLIFFSSCIRECGNKLTIVKSFSGTNQEEELIFSLQTDSNFVKGLPSAINLKVVEKGRFTFEVYTLVLAGRKYEPSIKWHADSILVSFMNVGYEDSDDVSGMVCPVQMKFDICESTKITSKSKVYFIHGNP